jgi:aspartyl-tRNA(Asn)/glutamyl-tRNA(Gln) amidotransferase subunit B
MEFEPVIGLEVHAQLKTQTKIFCGCSTAFGAPPNTHTCPVCLGMPGVLPVLNKKVVDYTLRMALATDCHISRQSRFARKNYFYPDLPKGYQISQYELPIAEHGFIDLELGGEIKRIGITRIHMEEDAGKLNHDPHRPCSMVDLNRTGVPLMEIVSEPDLRSPEEAGAYLRKLRTLIRYLGIGDGNMEEGSFRCDANVSIRPQGTEAFGTRTELKNLNSFKFVEKAIAHEIRRQKEVLLAGEEVIQETRLYDAAKNRTHSMRGKEEAHDYRYFPDPDLLPLTISDDWITSIQESLPELPDAKKARYQDQYKLTAYDAQVLTASREVAAYFEACVAAFPDAKLVSNWIMGPLMKRLNEEGCAIEASPVRPADLAQLLKRLDSDVISANIAKTVFEEMADSGKGAEQIIDAKGLAQVSDADALTSLVDDILKRCPDEVEKYRQGNRKLLGFFMGQVMKATKGQANPKILNQILTSKLDQT